MIDEASILVEGGRGGDGCVSFAREKYRPRGGTDGGDGGDGGDIVLEASESRSTLGELNRRRRFRAANGARGNSKNRFGARGEDTVIPVPVGTVARGPEGEVIGDLVSQGQRLVVAAGGKGGRGNVSLTGAAGRLPSFAEKGEPGEEIQLALELKLVADVALVGFPNAGKSTLISRISGARPKIADYPFTTIEPNLGAVEGEDIEYVVTDVPGLVEGAHDGKGMGDHFLRHIERASVIVYMADMSPDTGREPASDIEVLRREIEMFNPSMMSRRSVAVANKMDLNPDAESIGALREACDREGLELISISAATGKGLNGLLYKLEELVAEARAQREPEGAASVIFRAAPAEDVTVEKVEGGFLVRGKTVERMVLMTDWDNDEAREFLKRRLKGKGIDEKLARLGAVEGDDVEIAGRVFEYVPDTSGGGQEKVRSVE